MKQTLARSKTHKGAVGNPEGYSPLTDSYLPHKTGRALDTPETVKGCSTLLVSTPFWPTGSRHKDSRLKLRSTLLKLGHSRTFTDAFLTAPPRGPIHEQINGTRKQACTHPRTTRTKEQVSDCLSEFVLVSRVDPDSEKGPIFAHKRGQRPF
ncbi:hypothetical protein CRG98_028571 [Punica granatum]|uniref:Uncharacterized protein n=1 Tax=Punica granatum TaxID=22663 RepID=A0A2I0J5P0_PUNGR|nr:hypothetical protein CRG98_028571 [Punica granatum]